jgi:filamentous hemagglutinin family protein
MNHVYRVIWNVASGAWQAVSEVSKGSGKVKSERRRQRATAAGALLFISTQLCAAGLPQGGVVSSGTGNIAQPNANTLNVTQSSNKMAVDWQSFSVGQGKTVNFIQPGSSAVVLNRVIGNDVSSIQGAIKANGQVFLINPNGVIFSPTAQVNVGSLIASTRNITNEQFNAGNYRFEGNSNSAIINQSNITTADGGYVVLIAARIENTGSINASKGFVGLASGNLVTVDMGGPVKLKVEQGAIDSLISNGGIIKSEGGQILLTAKAAGDLAASVVNNRGIIEASSIDATGGKIVLLGDTISNSGKLAANGATGGGEILVGGDWQGSKADLYPHATRVTLSETSDISAQATQQGNGGKIVLWSGMDKTDGITAVAGRLNAESRGSQTDGGKIETSGKSLVIAEGTEVKTNGGEWLLDPVNIAIGSTLAGTISTALGSGSVTISTSGSNTPSTATGESGTDGDIAVNSSITKSSGSYSTLTFKAHRHITVASGVTVSSDTNKLNLVLWANQDGVADGRIEIGNSGSTLTNITTNGGGVWMGGGSGSTTWTPYSGASAITVGNGYALSTSGSTLSGSQSNGISLLATRITTAGGNVALYGDSESSVQVNDGIRMQYDATPTSATQINAGPGKIYVDGKTASGGTYNFGLDIKGTTLTSTSTAADAITLKGSSNTTGNDAAIVAGNTITASQGGVVLNLNTQSASDSAWDPGAASTITAKDLSITANGKLRLGSASDNKTTMLVSGTTTVNAQNGINIEMGSSANQLGTLQISGSLGSASIVNSNAMTLSGITGATGPLSVETLTGNLTLAGNVSTTSTATNAIVLNAGKNTAAGTSAGGDIIVSGSPTLTTGSGGRATLYTGSVAGSTGLTNLIGSGSGRFRYNSDESTTNFSTALAAGKYAIFRERPTVAVNVDNQSKTYDGLAFAGTNSATLTGFANGDSVANLTGSLSYTVNSGNTAKNAGTYTIAATGYSNGLGYNLAYNNGSLTINKAVITVTADDKTKTFGDANPAFTTTISGFVNGETAATAGVTGTASASSTATQNTAAGSAVINAGAGTLAASNYSFTNLVNGTLTIKANTATTNAVTSATSATNPTVIKQTTTPPVSNTTTLLDPKLSLAELKKIGTTAELLKANGYSAKALSDAGYDLKQLKEGGYSLADLKALGITEPIGPWAWPSDIAPLKKAGFTAIELKKSGAGFIDLSVGGYSNEELASVFSVRELADINKSSPPLKHILSLGYKASDFRDAGYTAADLKSNGADLASLVKSGFTVGELKSAGYTAKELRESGSTFVDLALAGFKGNDFKEAFSFSEVVEYSGLGSPNIGYALSLGYSKAEVTASGYTLKGLKGQDPKNLAKTFSVKEMLAEGYSIKDLVGAEGIKDSLLASGYTAASLVKAGFSMADLKSAGFSVSDLKKDFSIKEITNANFSGKEYKSAGVTVAELKEAGVSVTSLLILKNDERAVGLIGTYYTTEPGGYSEGELFWFKQGDPKEQYSWNKFEKRTIGLGTWIDYRKAKD